MGAPGDIESDGMNLEQKGRGDSEISEQTLSVDEKEVLSAAGIVTVDIEAKSQHTTVSMQAGDIDPLHSDSINAVNYKSCSWWHCGILMIAETISLGILSLPSAIATLGIFPGLVSIFGLGILATYSGYVIGQFKLRYPNVYSMADAGYILFGTPGYWLFYTAAQLSLIFIMAAHILTFSVAMNVLSGRAACSIVWAIVGVLLSICLTLPRTFKNVSYFSMTSFISITAAVFIVMTSIGVSKGHMAIGVGALSQSYGFSPTVLAILNITIAYMGNVAFFTFISELREPRDFTKALFFLQGCSISYYAIVAVVIYYYIGAEVPSPALGAARPIIQKIAYGIAMPTIIVAGVINASVACKSLYIQFWRWRGKQDTVASKSFKAIASWAGIVTLSWVVAGILALAIPIFNELLGLISALFGSWFTYGVCGLLWIEMNWTPMRNALSGIVSVDNENQDMKTLRWRCKKSSLLVLNAAMIILCMAMCSLGLYVTGNAIAQKDVGKSFSCSGQYLSRSKYYTDLHKFSTLLMLFMGTFASRYTLMRSVFDQHQERNQIWLTLKCISRRFR